jgi:peroxiredoxin Q/BCP
LGDFKGKRVVLYFYPKDDTPGCTKEACAFRDYQEDIQKQGVVVLGISVDDQASHKKFSEKYRLNFPLLADPTKEVARSYHALNMLRIASRVTYLIGRKGAIEYVWPKVNPETHSKEVLEKILALE